MVLSIAQKPSILAVFELGIIYMYCDYSTLKVTIWKGTP